MEDWKEILKKVRNGEYNAKKCRELLEKYEKENQEKLLRNFRTSTGLIIDLIEIHEEAKRVISDFEVYLQKFFTNKR